jgi:uncharacterized protein (TIGR03089 family)
VQLGPPAAALGEATDVAAALVAARDRLGARPAVSLLLATGRQEQAVVSLAQWAAKGAHLLEADLLLEPGDRLRLSAPLSWTTAAVCLACWWAGVVVVLDGPADVEVVYDDGATGEETVGSAAGTAVDASRPSEPGPVERLVVGDGIDGGPTRAGPLEPWVRAVQTFPDQPPSPRASGDRPALVLGDRSWTQAELLAVARSMGTGPIGVDATTVAPAEGIVAVVVRPLVTGRATVIVRGVDRTSAAGDRVAAWL